MKSKLLGSFLLGAVLLLSLAISARSDGDRDRDRRDRDWRDDVCRNDERNPASPVEFKGVVAIPGSPLLSTDLSFTDRVTERFYLADRSNAGVDVVDTELNTYVGRVPGFAGAAGANGNGPNGVLITPDKLLWAGDGNSTLQVADVDPTHANYLKIIQSVSTADPTFPGSSQCNNGTTNLCNRADELGYDGAHHIIMVANDQPKMVAPATTHWPYATFVDTKTFKILGQIVFTGAGGAEQPVWNPGMQRFLITLPGTSTQLPEIAVIDPTHLGLGIEKTYPINCATIPGGSGFGANGEALGPFQKLFVSACGVPIIMNAKTGAIIATISQVGGGDEVWFNPGDNQFYTTSTDNTVAAKPTVLGVIDAQSNAWIQNFPDPGGRNPSAFSENNHIFTPVRVTSGQVATPSTDNTLCTLFGFKGTGCVAVFAH
jgi:hypothetical protein